MNRASWSTRNLVIAALGACLASAGCTMKNQEAPPLMGPSEFATSITITVSPDVLTQDGASQSLVTITARDENGNPLRNLSLRAETFVNGQRVDFGSLSARNLVTDANGRATLVFTAPASPSGPGVDFGTTVQIVVTPVGTDFANSMPRLATIRLVPPGIVVPADGLRPDFTFDPESPADHQDVFFESTSTAPANNPIASHTWDFGDGGTGSGPQVTHAYSVPGLYNVTLTITDFVGRSAQTSKRITVIAGTRPTASFTFSPTEPVPSTAGPLVNFNGSASTAADGNRIVRYSWDFGDGTPRVTSGSPQTSHRYPGNNVEGTYTVTLIVTDDDGRTGLASQEVPVKFADVEEEIAIKKIPR
jgi:PKD repeat protein